MNHCLFETALGWIGLAWTQAGLARLQLPESNRAATARRLVGASATLEPPEHEWPGNIAATAARVRAYASGAAVDFASIELDLSTPDPFAHAIYSATRTVHFGRTITYGELAALAGHPGKAREVGQALARNPIALIVPCHRVLAAGGKLGGFSAGGGTITKMRLLSLEGAGPARSRQRSFAF